MKRNRDWKILYSNYDGLEKKAIELVSTEVGGTILRDPGKYTIHVLACEKAEEENVCGNCIIIGQYDGNALVRKYVQKNEIPDNGYVVKVLDDPDDAAHKLAVITANDARNVFYGAVDFVDDYLTQAAPQRSSIKFYDEVFDHPMPDYYNASAPVFRTRNIWGWAHPINDYRAFIENMARMRYNQLVLWNDHVPLNAKDVVDYCHEYGIEMIWGYAWGWSRKCSEIDFDKLDELSDEIVETYERDYAPTGCDGIYFQSFTEVYDQFIGERIIAEEVTNFVNNTAAKLLERHPGLYIQFGLHAMSVKEHLEYIEKVDPRVDILWEDCGTFPFHYDPVVPKAEDYAACKGVVERMLRLRNAPKGFLFKGMLVMDWYKDNFVHQAGPYVMGKMPQRVIESDYRMVTPFWRNYQADWLNVGHVAHDMARFIAENGGGDTTMGSCGLFAGGRWFPLALCAQIFWECDKPYEEILEKVMKRLSTTMV